MAQKQKDETGRTKVFQGSDDASEAYTAGRLIRARKTKIRKGNCNSTHLIGAMFNALCNNRLNNE